MPKYHILKIGAEDFELLVPLMKDSFGMDVNIDYFHWKYVKNPAGSFIGFVAIETATNDVGAYYGVIPQKFLIDGIEKTIYQSCDTMTHSNHRRQGLFKMLALECYKFLEENKELFVIGFGGAQSTPGFLKFGWKHVFDFKYYFRPAFTGRLTFMRSYPDSHFTRDNNMLNLESFLKNVDFTSGSNRSARTVGHMSWRIANPNYNYKIICYRQAEIEGYVIYYIHNNKLILFDFLFASSRAEKALLWFLSKEVHKKSYKGLIAFCQEKGRQAITLRKNGFISNPFKKGPLSEKTPFIFYAEDEVMKKYAAPGKWDITGYDHDAL